MFVKSLAGSFLVILSVSANAANAANQSTCKGILHTDVKNGGFYIGGGKGEDEGICVIGKADIDKVMQVCNTHSYCAVTGNVVLCKNSGECVEVSNVSAVLKGGRRD